MTTATGFFRLSAPHAVSPTVTAGKLLSAIVFAAAAWAIGGSASAQVYPLRPITWVVGYSVGGPSDTIARIMAERMKVLLGQPIVIENINGAAGSIAVRRVARAAPDGYTIGLGDGSTFVTNAAMYKLPYDVLEDFEPISMLPYAPQIIVAKSTVPAKNLSELLAMIKTNQNKVSYGTSGVGSPSHVSAVLLQNMTGAKFQLVSYRGAGQIMTDIISGHIDLSIAAPSVVLAQWRAGNARAFAITAKDRISAAPDIPTVDEAGLPGFYTSLWWGLWVPRGAPDYIIAKLNAAVVESLADPVVRARFAEQGLDMPTREQQRPEALRAFQKAEIEKWWPIIKAASIKAQ